MDDVFIGNTIPADYHYAIFGNGYIDLYKVENLTNGTFDYYRIYTNCGGFYYSHNEQRYPLTSTTKATLVGVSDKWYNRNDKLSILMFVFIIALCSIWFVNLVTSVFKKGGLLGGLL